ncbi:MAG: hypothetical protein ACFCUE_02585 [Candidatus Bathyarchaeia archaeon]|jgi:hypothetical protein
MQIAVKGSGLFLFIVAVLSILALTVTPVIAGSNPSVPEFSAAFIDASYDVPTTYSTDPYTGETVTHQGYHVQNRTLEVTIKNQPFTAYEENGQIINFYLNIRIKGAHTKEWINIYSPDRGYLTQSNSEYTKVAYSLDDNEFPFWDNIPEGGTVDFQVEALVGSVHRSYNPNATEQLDMYPYVFTGKTSGWSNTHTVTVPKPAADPLPTTPELPTITLLPIIAAATLTAIILKKKQAQVKNSTR